MGSILSFLNNPISGSTLQGVAGQQGPTASGTTLDAAKPGITWNDLLKVASMNSPGAQKVQGLTTALGGLAPQQPQQPGVTTPSNTLRTPSQQNPAMLTPDEQLKGQGTGNALTGMATQLLGGLFGLPLG